MKVDKASRFPLDEQVEIMETQLESFDGIADKIEYLNVAFTNDTDFTKEAHDIVFRNINIELKRKATEELK